MSLTRVALSLQELELFDPSLAGFVVGQGRGEQRALCPLCGQGKPRDAAHRSLSLSRETGVWHCYRCGEGGKVREAWEERSPLQQRERARLGLTRTFGLTSPTASSRQASPSAQAPQNSGEVPDGASSLELWKRDLGDLRPLEGAQSDGRGALYLNGRGLSADHAHWAGVRFCSRFMGRPAIVFPLRDQDGRLRGAHARYVDGRDRPKARTVGDKRGSLFATAGAFDTSLPAIIVTEAPLDALSLAQAGYPAVAVCGTQAPTWLHRVCAFRRVLLAFDGDDAGDNAAEKLVSDLGMFGARCERLRPEKFKDWNDALQSGRDELSDWLAERILWHSTD